MRSHAVLLRLAATLGLAVLLAGTVRPSPVYAQTITVTTTAEAPGASGDCTLGEAVQAANTNAPVDACPAGTLSDTIVLQPGAAYTLTTGVSGEFGPSAFVITTTVIVQGNGAALAHDPGAGALRFFYVDDPGSLTLSNVTLRGGRAKGSDGADGTATDDDGDSGQAGTGGAVLVGTGTLTLDGAAFIDNAVEGGRGGDGWDGPDIQGSAGGTGGGGLGGAVAVVGLLVITDNGAVFSGNAANGGLGGLAGVSHEASGAGGEALGGAVYATGTQFLPGAHITADDNLAQGGRGGGTGTGGDGGRAWGGALLLHDSTQAALTHSHFYNNRVVGGPVALVVQNGRPVGGAGFGAAIASSGQLTLTHTSVVSNTAVGGIGREGGASAAGGVLVYTNGGAASLAVRHSLVMSNTALGGSGGANDRLAGAAGGGGIYAPQVPVLLEASAVVANAAIQGTNPNTVTVAGATGGGLLVGGDNVEVLNTTFAHNLARQGGGVYNGVAADTALTLTHVTVYDNIAEQGGGLYNDDAEGTLLLRNSVVAHNTAGNCFGTISLAGENMQHPPAGLCGLATAADPLLGTLGDHGGGTLTLDLLAGSPALDAAAPAFCPPHDQRGVSRPLGQGCDLGAYERWGQIFLALIKR